jgi:lincosamide nucleotidyltransferase A/C/D/E
MPDYNHIGSLTLRAFWLDETALISMTASDVLNLYSELEELGIKIWIDGGWGVDALLERQTRPHKDLDIIIQQKDVSQLRRLLEPRGYREIRLNEARPWNFVLGDEGGREIDFHVIVVDAKGNGLYGPLEKDEMYPAASLTGTGSICGEPVRCISPEWMVKFHSGYVLQEKDYRDVSALCEKFHVPLPQAFAAFKTW